MDEAHRQRTLADQVEGFTRRLLERLPSYSVVSMESIGALIGSGGAGRG